MNTSFDRLALVNTYGAFGTVGRERDEIIFEGTSDDAARRDGAVAGLRVPVQAGGSAAATLRRVALPAAARLADLVRGDGEPGRVSLDAPLRLEAAARRPRRAAAARERSVPGRAAALRPRAASTATVRPARTTASGAWWKRELLGDWLPPLSARGSAAAREPDPSRLARAGRSRRAGALGAIGSRRRGTRMGRVLRSLGIAGCCSPGSPSGAGAPATRRRSTWWREARTSLGIPLESALDRDQRDPAPRGAGRAPRTGRRCVLLHGFPEFWWTWHAQIDGARAGGLPRDRPGSARLRALGQAAAHRGLPHARSAAPTSWACSTRSDTSACISPGTISAASSPGISRSTTPSACASSWSSTSRTRRSIASPPPPEPGRETTNWFRTFFQLPWLPELVGPQRELVSCSSRNLVEIEPPGHLRGAGARLLQVRLGARERDPHDARLVPRELPLPLRPPAPDPRVRMPTRIVWGDLDRFNDPRFAEPSLAFCDARSSCASRMPATGCSTRSRPRRASC